MEFARILVLCLILCSSTTALSAVPKEQELDRITALPGQPPVNFAQFSGYITVNETHGRALFYWLTEATTDPLTKPLVLWLNGGPGCSSIAYGASEEIGPFRINKTGDSLYLNEFSWNREANILFLDSPAGVGFSYSNTSADLELFGDGNTAEDALVFVTRWFQRFPQYHHRDFYIAGESYAGHYGPQLANKLYDYNKKSPDPIINLKGFILGNAAIDINYDSLGTLSYWLSHSMISDQTYKTILDSCDFKSPNNPKKCYDAVDVAYNHDFGKINQYSIYTEPCSAPAAASSNGSSAYPRRWHALFQATQYDPCTVNYAEKYYNRPDVQKALHANTTRIPYKWTACSKTIRNNWREYTPSELPVYKKLIAAGLRIWVYSGDTDAVVPPTATKLSLSQLKLKIKTPWYPWYADGQVGGRTEVYEGLTFATVRGAGHEVPLFQAGRAFKLFQTFLSGKQLPES